MRLRRREHAPAQTNNGAGSEEFDEATYLAYHPDVAAAVAKGRYASGRQHYEKFGRAEGRGEEGRIWPLHRIAVEEIAVVEIAVGSRIRHRLGRLVDRIIIAFAKCHRDAPTFTRVLPRD